MARIAIVGATGMIGRALAAPLVTRGDDVVAVSRRGAAGIDGARDVRWDPAAGPPPGDVTRDVDAVVNLAGSPIAKWPWTASRKREIRDSRISTTRLLAERVGGDGSAGVLVNASGIDYYGHVEGDRIVDETAPAGAGFLADVCREWENAAAPAAERGARVVVLRTSPVLDGSEGILPRLAGLTRFMLGGPVAGGGQWMSWIHIHDYIAVILRAIDDDGLSGPVNATSPEPVRQREFMRVLGDVLGRPARTPAPGFAVRLALGEMSALLLEGRRAVPGALTVRGFALAPPQLEDALREALARPG
jgi:uncharacterized protein